VHEVPPVEVMRTVDADTAPFEAAGPKALTQSPTARSVAAAACVEVTVVEPAVVTLRLCVLGVAGFLFLSFLELDFELFAKLPGEMSTPETETVEPLTEVTLPDATAIDPNRRAAPAGNEGRVPLVPPAPPGRNRKPPGRPANAPAADVLPLPLRNEPAQDPVDGVLTVMVRAARVVLDDFDGVPVAMMQSPAAREATVSVTVLENCVDDVQLTVVWPTLGFCTSMLDPESAATLPLAPEKEVEGFDAAPAAETRPVAATSAVALVAMNRAPRRRLVLWLVRVCM
jgi:hypothetical protein